MCARDSFFHYPERSGSVLTEQIPDVNMLHVMKIIETKVYQFDELPEPAKEKARDWYREASAGDNYFSEAIIEDAQECAKFIGIEISHARGGKGPAIYWSGEAKGLQSNSVR